MFKDVVDCNSSPRDDSLASLKRPSEPEDNAWLRDTLERKRSVYKSILLSSCSLSLMLTYTNVEDLIHNMCMCLYGVRTCVCVCVCVCVCAHKACYLYPTWSISRDTSSVHKIESNASVVVPHPRVLWCQ